VSELRATASREQARDLITGAARIFIAYSHSDLAAAVRFRRAIVRLRRARPPDSVFLDEESLTPGGNVSRQDLLDRLRRSDLVVVLCGSNTAASHNVDEEVEVAIALRDEKRLTILPVLLVAHASPPRALDFQVQGIHLTSLFPEIQRRRIAAWMVLGSAVVGLAVVGTRAVKLRGQAKSSALEARAQRLMVESRAALKEDPDRAALLAVEGLRISTPALRSQPGRQQALRDALQALPGHVLGWQNGPVIAAVATSDGKRLATASESGGAAVWDLAAHDLGRQPRLLPGAVTGLAIDGRGRWLVTGDADGTARVWDLETTGAGRILEPHPDERLTAVAISGDARWAAAISERRGWLWRLEEGAPVGRGRRLFDGMDVSGLAIDPSSTWLAANVTCSAHVVELAAPDSEQRLLGPPSTCVKALTFTRDGRWLFTGSHDNVLRLWDLRSRAVDPVTTAGLMNGLKSMAGIDLVAALPDGSTLLTGYGDGSVQLWSWRPPKPPAPGPVLDAREGPVREVSALADESGRWLATRSSEGLVHLWDLTSDDPERSGPVMSSRRETAALALARGGWIATGSVSGAVRAQRLPERWTGVTYTQIGTATAISPDSRWLATAAGKDIRLRDLRHDEVLDGPLLRGHAKDVSQLEISGDGRWLASAAYDGSVRLWDLRAADIATSGLALRGPGGHSRPVVFGGGGRWLISGADDGRVWAWDLRGGGRGVAVELRHPADGETGAIASEDGRWLATGSTAGAVGLFAFHDDRIDSVATLGKNRDDLAPSTFAGGWLLTHRFGCRAQLWPLDSARPAPVELQVCRGDYFATDASDDGRWLATGGEDGSVRLMDLQHPAAGAPIDHHDGPISRVAFTPGGRWLVTAGADAMIHLSRVGPSGASPAVRLRGHEAAITIIKVTRDQRWLLSGDSAGAVRLWDLEARDVAASVGRLPDHRGRVVWATATPDARWAVTLGMDGGVQLSNLTLDWMLRRARQAVGRNFTAEEWHTHLADEPYRATFDDLPIPPRPATP
jgi:WD40 repeat protein